MGANLQKKGAMLLGYAFIAVSILTVCMIGLSQHSAMDTRLSVNNSHDLQAMMAAESGLEYGLAYLKGNQPTGAALYPAEVVLHNYGPNYGGKGRYTTTFQVSALASTPYLFLTQGSTIGNAWACATNPFVASPTSPAQYAAMNYRFFRTNGILPDLASSCSYTASSCVLTSTGRVYEMDPLSMVASQVVAVTVVERLAVYNASPALAMFESRTFSMK